MAEVCHELTIAAEPEKLFEAISTQDGLRSFWTDQTEAEPAVGSIAQFKFGPTGAIVFDMRVDTLDAPRLIEWKCIGGPDEWLPTRIRWELTPASSGGTTVAFQHLDWESFDGELPKCSYTWAMILKRLEQYMTTGECVPYFMK